MKTMLVPIDFSATSDNALTYAVEWSKAFGYDRIILLKTIYDSLFESVTTSAGYMHINGDYKSEEREEASERLQSICREVIQKEAPGVKVTIAISEEPLLRSIVEIVAKEKLQLVVIGSDNYSYSSDSFIAGQVISIARISPVRVLIVPSHYQYQEVKQALVPCDFSTLFVK